MMVLYGAGDHCRVVMDVLNDLGKTVAFVLDDNKCSGSSPGLEIRSPDTYQSIKSLPVLVTIGDNGSRKRIVEKFCHFPSAIIHPSALTSKSAKIGEGSILMHRCIVQCEVTIGTHVIINTGAIIEHHCHIENFCHIAPGAILCGNVFVGQNTLIGAGAVIIPNVKIGATSIVGAGSVVTHDIPQNSVVAGNPARIIKPHYIQ